MSPSGSGHVVDQPDTGPITRMPGGQSDTLAASDLNDILDNEKARTRWGFTDHEHLNRTGLIHMNGRVYDPRLGRFLSRDPVVSGTKYAQAWNRYAYVGNQPMAFTDPSGYALEFNPNFYGGGDDTPGSLGANWLFLDGHFGHGGSRHRGQGDDNPFPFGFPTGGPTDPSTGITETVGPTTNITQSTGVLIIKEGILLIPGADIVDCTFFDACVRSDWALAVAGLYPPAKVLKLIKLVKILKRAKHAEEAAEVAAKGAIPGIKAGAAGGETAGKNFAEAVREAAKAENPLKICVYCRREGMATQVDHAIPKARGGNATLENAQLACPHCNPSKGARAFPVTPPPGFRGEWPPSHCRETRHA